MMTDYEGISYVLFCMFFNIILVQHLKKHRSTEMSIVNVCMVFYWIFWQLILLFLTGSPVAAVSSVIVYYYKYNVKKTVYSLFSLQKYHDLISNECLCAVKDAHQVQKIHRALFFFQFVEAIHIYCDNLLPMRYNLF